MRKYSHCYTICGRQKGWEAGGGPITPHGMALVIGGRCCNDKQKLRMQSALTMLSIRSWTKLSKSSGLSPTLDDTAILVDEVLPFVDDAIVKRRNRKSSAICFQLLILIFIFGTVPSSRNAGLHGAFLRWK